MSPRTGRPTDNPRPNKISIRISDEDKETRRKIKQSPHPPSSAIVLRSITSERSDIVIISSFSVEIKNVLKGDFIMKEAIIKMLEKADERKLRLIYIHIRALMGLTGGGNND